MNLNATLLTWQCFCNIMEKRQVDPKFISFRSRKLVELIIHSYAASSDTAFFYLEVTLDKSGGVDFQLCDNMVVPSGRMEGQRVEGFLDFIKTNKVDCDFAFDTSLGEKSRPNLYMVDIEKSLDENMLQGYCQVLHKPQLLNPLLQVTENMPASYHFYYLGDMINRQPSCQHLGFFHKPLRAHYAADIDSFIVDLRALGYQHPVSPEMRQELIEAGKYGYLGNTQLSMNDEGEFIDRIGMSATFADQNYHGALEFLENPRDRQYYATELDKLRISKARPFFVPGKGAYALCLRSNIGYVKCNWIKGVKQPLKVYIYLRSYIVPI